MTIVPIRPIGILIIIFISLCEIGYCGKIDSLKNEIEINNDNYVKIRLLNNLSEAYRDNKQYENAVKSASNALNIAKWENYTVEIITSYRNLGHAYYYYNDHAKALENYLYAVKYLNKTNNDVLLAKTYRNIAIIYNLLKKPKEALKFNKFCLEKLKDSDDTETLLSCYINFADSYQLLNDHKTEIYYLGKVVEIRVNKKQFELLGLEYNNIGGAYWKAKRYDSALVYFNKLKNISLNYQDTLQVARALTNIGCTYTSLGKYSESLQYFQQSLQLNTSLDAFTNMQIIYASLEWGKLSKIDKLFSECIKKGVETRDIITLSDSIRKTYERNGNITKAYYYSKVKDSLETTLNADVESTVKLQYEVDGIETRIAEKENYALMQENLELRSQQNRFLIAILLLIFTIGIGGVYLFRKRLKEREKRLVFVEEGVAEMGKVLEDIKALRSEKKAFL